MKRFAMLSSIGASLLIGSALMAAPVSDEALQSAIETYSQKFQEGLQNRTLNREGATALSNEALSSLDVSDLTFEQIMELNGANVLTYASGEQSEAVIERLKTFASQKDVEGATASVILAGLTASSSEDPSDVVVAMGETLRHPSIVEAMKTEIAGQFFSLLGYLERLDAESISDDVVAFGESIGNDFYAEAAPMIGAFNGVVNNVASKEQAKEIRGKLVAWAETAKEELQDARMVGAIDRTLAMMNSAFGRGELIGYTAPELNFNWISSGSYEKLSDLKGKVVVIDFWATWCGPCIASFPDVAKLQKFYAGYPVEIIGVTSLQGNHSGQDGRVDTSGDPDKEYGLMPGFMEWKNMTWPVAFTEEEVFNQDYGVSGIPHVAIVDTQGKVRFNKIHPSSQVTPMKEKVEMINGLLKEANLDYPVWEDEG